MITQLWSMTCVRITDNCAVQWKNYVPKYGHMVIASQVSVFIVPAPSLAAKVKRQDLERHNYQLSHAEQRRLCV